MTGSRRFLLVLLLASVTCVVLVQISMDGKYMSKTLQYNEEVSLNDYETSPEKRDNKRVQREKLSVIKSNISTSGSRATPIPPKILIPKTTNMFPKSTKSPVNNINKLEKKVGIGQAVGKGYIHEFPQQNLISRQERIQELVKQNSVVQKRPPPDPMRSLRPIPTVDPQKVTRIVLLTYFRSGSTFFGDILQQNWKTFYHFEPLHSMTYDRRIKDDRIEDVYQLFNDIFRCNFTNQKNYMEWIKQPRNQFLFAHNMFLWVTCHGNPKSCYNASFVNSVCDRAPVHVMKVTRLHMRHLKTYVKANPDLNLKVIYLTRDPRGIISSRWSLEWCKGTNCSDSGVLCNEMSEDLAIFHELKKEHPLNFIKVRYEDLSLNPENETQKLFKFLHLPFSVSVKKFLKTHTVSRKNDDKNPYSTRRNTTAMVFSWRDRFSYDQVMQVQSECGDVLNKLNHSLITIPDQLPYPNGRPNTLAVSELNSSQINRFHNNPLAKKYFAKMKDATESSKNLHTYNQHLNNTNIEIHKSYKIIEKHA